MKKTFIFLLLLLPALQLFSQTGKVYKWKSLVPINQRSIDLGVTFTAVGTPVVTPLNSLIKIVSESGNDVVFYFLNWGHVANGEVTVDPSRIAKFNAYNVETAKLPAVRMKGANSAYDEADYLKAVVYFKVAKTTLDSHAELIESPWNLGAVTMPFKIRLKGGDFESDFPLALALSLRLKGKLSAVAAAGYGSVSLTNENASKLSATDKVNDLRIFSWSLGFMLNLDGVQLVGMLGFDYLSGINQTKYGWNYHKMPYISFGIGTSIFKLKGAPKENN